MYEIFSNHLILGRYHNDDYCLRYIEFWNGILKYYQFYHLSSTLDLVKFSALLVQLWSLLRHYHFNILFFEDN